MGRLRFTRERWAATLLIVVSIMAFAQVSPYISQPVYGATLSNIFAQISPFQAATGTTETGTTAGGTIAAGTTVAGTTAAGTTASGTTATGTTATGTTASTTSIITTATGTTATGTTATGTTATGTTATGTTATGTTFPQQYLLTIQLSAGGAVAPATGFQNSNAVIPILALANSGYSFVSWTGSGSGSFSGNSPSATVTMDGPITEIATFTPTSMVQITLESSTSGIIQVDGSSIITPQTFTWIPGTTHSLYAAFNPYCYYNCQPTFFYWTSPSIGTVYSQSITYTVPSFSETVNAVYQIPQPNTASITIASNPSGLNSIYADGSQITTPQTFTWTMGSTHTLTANQYQYCGSTGCQTQFSYWQSSSIGTTDSASLTYTVPTYSETVTANYIVPASNAFSFAFGSYGSGNGQFNNPHFIAVDSSGNMYITDSNNARVEKFDKYGNYVTQWGSFGSGNGQFTAPAGVAVDSSGNVYVVDSGNHRVEKFTSSGTYLSQFSLLGSGNGQFEDPTSIAVDSSGNVYVGDNITNRVQEFTSSGTYLTQFGSPGAGNGQFGSVTGIAIDPSSGNIYAVDSLDNRVEEFTSSGAYVSQWGSIGSGNGQFKYPYGIAVDSSGRIYVTDSGNNRVEVFTTSGTYLNQFGLQGDGNGQFVNPAGVAVDSSGNVYVVDNANNRVEVFQPLR